LGRLPYKVYSEYRDRNHVYMYIVTVTWSDGLKVCHKHLWVANRRYRAWCYSLMVMYVRSQTTNYAGTDDCCMIICEDDDRGSSHATNAADIDILWISYTCVWHCQHKRGNRITRSHRGTDSLNTVEWKQREEYM
jgi:hypothetical protein